MEKSYIVAHKARVRREGAGEAQPPGLLKDKDPTCLQFVLRWEKEAHPIMMPKFFNYFIYSINKQLIELHL